MKEIRRGAEAIIYLEKNIIKDRIVKGYRIEKLDSKIRQFRTRREAKILEKLSKFDFAPKLINVNDKKMIIIMENIKGKLLADYFEEVWKETSQEIGEKVSLIHSINIIHGDLTTSNMILNNRKIFFIDFGLSFFSDKVEDKAVDLHLLKQALESKHYTVNEKAFKKILEGYGDSEVIKRLEQVEKRGRNKSKH